MKHFFRPCSRLPSSALAFSTCFFPMLENFYRKKRGKKKKSRFTINEISFCFDIIELWLFPACWNSILTFFLSFWVFNFHPSNYQQIPSPLDCWVHVWLAVYFCWWVWTLWGKRQNDARLLCWLLNAVLKLSLSCLSLVYLFDVQKKSCRLLFTLIAGKQSKTMCIKVEREECSTSLRRRT